MANYYEPTPNATDAYHTDGTHKWFGKASKGALTSMARWQIIKMEYTGNDWIIKYPQGDDSPKFVWDSVESYTYRELGT